MPGSEHAEFLCGEQHDDHATLHLHARGSERLGRRHHNHRTRNIVQRTGIHLRQHTQVVEVRTENDVFVLEYRIGTFDDADDIGRRIVGIEFGIGRHAHGTSGENGLTFEGFETVTPLAERTSRTGHQFLGRSLADESHHHVVLRTAGKRIGIFRHEEHSGRTRLGRRSDFGPGTLVLAPHLQRIEVFALIGVTSFAQDDLAAHVDTLVIVVFEFGRSHAVTHINQLAGHVAVAGKSGREIILARQVVFHDGIFAQQVKGFQVSHALHVVVGLRKGVLVCAVVTHRLEAPFLEMVDHISHRLVVTDISRTAAAVLVLEQFMRPGVDVLGCRRMECGHHGFLLVCQLRRLIRCRNPPGKDRHHQN